MLKRIVKMSFQPDKVGVFLQDFEQTKSRIRNFKGCSHLELLRDQEDPGLFFTYSFWEDPAALEAYRSSALFKDVWARTKLLFNEKPQAWSVEQVTRG